MRTGLRGADSPVTPANREIYRESCRFGLYSAVFASNLGVNSRGLPAKSPAKQNRGFFSWNREIFGQNRRTGKAQRHDGLWRCRHPAGLHMMTTSIRGLISKNLTRSLQSGAALVSKSPAGRAREETVFGSHPLLTSGALGFKAQCSVRLESTNSPLR